SSELSYVDQKYSASRRGQKFLLAARASADARRRLPVFLRLLDVLAADRRPRKQYRGGIQIISRAERFAHGAAAARRWCAALAFRLAVRCDRRKANRRYCARTDRGACRHGLV